MIGGPFGYPQKPVFNRIDIARPGLDGATADGLWLINTSPALAGHQQYSPNIRFTAAGSKTTAPFRSQSLDFRVYSIPVTGGGNITGNLVIDASVGGVAFGTRMTLTSNGKLTSDSDIGPANNTDFLLIGTRSKLGSSSDGLFNLFNNGATDFTRLNFGGTSSSFPGIGRSGTSLEILGADGAGPANLWIYNTKTSSTNFERADLQWATNVFQLWTEKGSGGGTARDFVLGADATELMRFQTGTKLSFFAATPVVKQASAANLTNNVTAGGTTDQIDNYTDLAIYANDSAAIRNDIYQLARKLKQVNDALRTYGLLT